MTSVYFDNFDSDAANALPAGWVNKVGTWVATAVRPVSGTQALAASSGGDGAVALYTGIAARTDMEVSSDHLALVAAPNLQNVSHLLRMDAAYSNGYACLLNSTNGADYSFIVFKRVGGAFTQIASSPSGVSVVNGDTVHFSSKIVGSTISLYLWKGAASKPASPNYSFSDGSVTGAGYAGVYNATGGSGTPSLDNFNIDDAGGGGGGTTINALTAGTGNVRFSPYNWNVLASSAKTINAGAYFKTIFSGTTCALTFDMTGIATPLPQISYRIDGFGPWITVPIAASVSLTIPGDTADYADKPGHLLEVVVKSMTETQPRWATQSTAVALTGILVDTGKAITPPPTLPLKGIFYGDSITEGVRTVNMTAPNDTDRNDAGQAWPLAVGRILGAEVGNVGFGATGFNTAGSGGVPALPSSYNLLYSGVARSFAASPDFIVLMEGTNDGGSVTANATTVLNALIAATTAKIIVLRPFNGTAHAAELQAAIAACTAPARCTYVNTAGFFTTANSSDALHPYGVENLTHIAPLVADAIRTILAGAPTLTARTVSLTLGDTNGAAANLTGLKVSFFDEASPDLFTVPRFKTSAGTTNAAGLLTFAVNSTLGVGGTGHITVLGAANVHFNGPVVVS